MKKLIFLLVTSLFLISSTYALTACENLIADPCFGQEERCEFKVTTSRNIDLTRQGGEYGSLNNADRDWYDLREIKRAYSETATSGGDSLYEYSYTPCGSDECDIMPIKEFVTHNFNTDLADWRDWDADKYGYTFHGQDIGGNSGAFHIKPKEGFLIKIKFCFADEDSDEGDNLVMKDFLKRGSRALITDYTDGINSDRLLWVDSSKTSGGFNCAKVILDGDNNDYLSVDPSRNMDDVHTFKLVMSKPDGTDMVYEYSGDSDLDWGSDTEKVTLHLHGYENKNYLELREQCDQEEALEAAEKDRAPSISDVIINVVEGSSTNLKLENFPLSGNDQLASIKLTPKDDSFINSRDKTTKPSLLGYSEESYYGYNLGYDYIKSSDLNSYDIDAKDMDVVYSTTDRSKLFKIATYQANRVTSYGGSAYSDSKNIYVNITDSNTPISIGNKNSIDIEENTNNDKELRSYDLSDFCHDPDSYITYSTPSLTGSSLSNHILPYITKNKLYFYLNDHDTSKITGSIKCKELQYESELTVPITINIAEVDEDISVKGSSTLDDFPLGSINFATGQSGINEEFVIEIENPDKEDINVAATDIIRTTKDRDVTYIVSGDSVILTYKPEFAGSDSATISINGKKLNINFIISDTNSPIRWATKQIDLPGAIEDTNFEITKESLASYYYDEEVDTIKEIILINTDKEFVSVSPGGELIITPIKDNLGHIFLI